MTQKDSVSSYLEWIYTNWYLDEGPCGECPIRSGEKEPYFGDGTYPADIVLIGSEPGGPRKLPENPHESLIDSDLYDSHTERIRERKHMREWFAGTDEDGNSRVPDSFWEQLEVGFDQEADNRVYYTNLMKCSLVNTSESDTHADESKEDIDPHTCARDKCSTYLPEELRRVDPSVVVPLGNNAVNMIYEYYGIGESEGVTTEVGRHIRLEEFSVIPAVHWSYLQTFSEKIAEDSYLSMTNANTDSYWRALAERIEAAL